MTTHSSLSVSCDTVPRPPDVMEEPHDETFADLFLSVLRDLGCALESDDAILDFGCGEGRQVTALRARGYRAFGVDVYDRSAAAFAQCLNSGFCGRHEQIFSAAELVPYRLPYDEGAFAVVFSNQVMEHVQDWGAALAEIHRVLRPGGVMVHFFPSRWRVIESHVHVPLASVFQGLPYLKAWAWLGVRTAAQKHLSWEVVARANHQYLTTRTNYLSKSQIQRYAERQFGNVRFAEDVFIRHTTGSARKLRPLLRLPAIATLFSAFHRRVITCHR